tara:strand:- start:126 stop:347 length:222 start_codon:yes stop_codon:yes gene_type:complete
VGLATLILALTLALTLTPTLALTLTLTLTRWDSLPNAPWPPFRVYDLCTGAWLSFAYEDVFEVRLPAVGDQVA